MQWVELQLWKLVRRVEGGGKGPKEAGNKMEVGQALKQEDQSPVTPSHSCHHCRICRAGLTSRLEQSSPVAHMTEARLHTPERVSLQLSADMSCCRGRGEEGVGRGGTDWRRSCLSEGSGKLGGLLVWMSPSFPLPLRLC